MGKQAAIFLNSVLFVLGFSIVFSSVGVLLQTVLSFAAYDVVNLLRIVGGSVIIFFGFFLIASLKYRIPILQSEHRFKVKKFNSSHISDIRKRNLLRLLSSFVFGVAFALGWTPCVGAVLGSVYTLAATQPGSGFLLLLTYSLGIGIPFLVIGAFTSKASRFIEKSQKFLKYFNIVGGILLMLIGFAVLFNYIGIIAGLFVNFGSSVSIAGQLNFLIAFVAGAATFLSPCILPLIPAYLSYMAGTTVLEVKKK